MRSRGLPSTEGVAAPAARAAWTRRVIVGGLGTAGATVALAALAASAFANAANPTSASSTMTLNADQSVSVTVSGTWSWGELAGVQTSPQKDCAGRSGVGWSVDWWGMSNSPTPTAGKGPTTGSLVNPATSKTTPPSLTSGSLSVAGTWQVKSGPSQGQFFHTSHLFNGFLADLCNNATPTPTGPIGSYSATALYPNINAVPAKICVNFYDPHGSQGSYSTSAGDNFADQAGDNSIKTNSFDPTLVTGNCSVPVLTNPSIKVDKTNDADQNGGFTKVETAKTAGQAVTFQVTVTNPATATAPVIIDSVTDAVPSTATNPPGVACLDGNDHDIIGQTLAVGGSVTCRFTQNNYAPATGSLVDRVVVNVHQVGQPNSKGSDFSESTVNAPTGTPKIDYGKTGPATGIAGSTGDYTITLTNNGTATAHKPLDFVDVLPPGETFNKVLASSDDGMSCTAGPVTAQGQTVSCTYNKDLAAKDSAVVNIRANFAPGTEGKTLRDCVGSTGNTANVCWDTKIKEPKFQITKTGPDTGVPGGNGSYTITVKNIGDGPATAVSFVDNLPADESFISASGDFNCTETSATKISCTAKTGLLPLDPNDSLSVNVLVKYALTTREGDHLTDCAVLPNLDQACKTTIIHTPDVAIGKTGPATGVAGDKGTYTILVKNNGQAPANSVTFTDQLPVGESYVSFSSSTITCSLSANPQVVNCQVNAPLAVGASASVDVTVMYALDTAGKTLTDCAVLSQGNQSCVPTKIPGKPSISVVKTNDADNDGVFHDTEQAKNPGVSVTFKVVVTNTGPEPIVLDSVSDAFSATTLAECPNLIGTTLGNGDSVTCLFTVDNYAPAAGSSLTDTVTVGGHQTPGGTPVSASDTSTVTTRQPPNPGSPDLAIVKNADQDRVRAGDTLTYTLEVSNVGDGPTTGAVTVTDSVPSGLDLVSVDGGSLWACSASGRDITCTYQGGVLDPGDVAPQITVVTTVNDTAVIQVVNTGVVDTPGDTNPTNDRSTVKTPVIKVLPEKVVKPQPTTVLPFTGDRTGQMLPLGLLTVLLGVALTLTGRRKRRTN